MAAAGELPASSATFGSNSSASRIVALSVSCSLSSCFSTARKFACNLATSPLHSSSCKPSNLLDFWPSIFWYLASSSQSWSRECSWELIKLVPIASRMPGTKGCTPWPSSFRISRPAATAASKSGCRRSPSRRWGSLKRRFTNDVVGSALGLLMSRRLSTEAALAQKEAESLSRSPWRTCVVPPVDTLLCMSSSGKIFFKKLPSVNSHALDMLPRSIKFSLIFPLSTADVDKSLKCAVFI
mmetsp:Transcript_45113/g.119295  ORF Transcript_45113/g.119295 Transcript_45113/m.119295 type:complete len:240 (-) Transcript_45113:1132-1851(-)